MKPNETDVTDDINWHRAHGLFYLFAGISQITYILQLHAIILPSAFAMLRTFRYSIQSIHKHKIPLHYLLQINAHLSQ